MPIIFLEPASAHRTATSETEATATCLNLVGTLRALRKVNKKISLNSTHRLPDCEVSPGRSIGSTLGGALYKEEWEFLRLLATQSPLSQDLEAKIAEAELIEALPSGEKKYFTHEGTATIWAYLLDSAVVSFHTFPPWIEPWIECKIQALREDGEVEESEEKIRNSSSPSHVANHENWLRTLGLNQDPTSRQLWEEREDRYPGLRFLDQVRDQLNTLSTSGAPFRQAIATLELLNRDAINWSGVGQPIFSSKVADGEHDQRRQLTLFRDDTTGELLYFDRHAYFTGSFPGRIHFLPSVEEKVFVIGYVGYKLQ